VIDDGWSVEVTGLLLKENDAPVLDPSRITIFRNTHIQICDENKIDFDILPIARHKYITITDLLSDKSHSMDQQVSLIGRLTGGDLSSWNDPKTNLYLVPLDFREYSENKNETSYSVLIEDKDFYYQFAQITGMRIGGRAVWEKVILRGTVSASSRPDYPLAVSRIAEAAISINPYGVAYWKV
jgi:hypothetical protein